VLPIHLPSLTHRHHCCRHHSVTFAIALLWFHLHHHSVAFAVIAVMLLWCLHCCIIAVSSSHCRSVIVVVLPSSLHCCGVVVTVLLSPSQCHLCHRIIMVLLLLFHHHSFVVALAVSPLPLHRHGVVFIVAVSQSLSWCCIHCCSVAFIVMVLQSSLWCYIHCCGVAFIVTLLWCRTHWYSWESCDHRAQGIEWGPWPSEPLAIKGVVCGSGSMSKGWANLDGCGMGELFNLSAQ